MFARDQGLSQTERREMLLDGLSRSAAGLPELVPGGDPLDLVGIWSRCPPLRRGSGRWLRTSLPCRC